MMSDVNIKNIDYYLVEYCVFFLNKKGGGNLHDIVLAVISGLFNSLAQHHDNVTEPDIKSWCR